MDTRILHHFIVVSTEGRKSLIAVRAIAMVAIGYNHEGKAFTSIQLIGSEDSFNVDETFDQVQRLLLAAQAR